MAKHEFGIIDRILSESDNFQDYEPEKYGCICIDDEYIEKLMPSFESIPTFFHRLTWQETGLNYIGITLIPPSSCKKFSDILKGLSDGVYDELCKLFDRAFEKDRFVIHYGL